MAALTLKFRFVGKIVIPSTKGKETAKCFQDPWYRHRSHRIDLLLPKTQPATEESIITALSSEEEWELGDVLPLFAGERKKFSITPSQMEEVVKMEKERQSLFLLRESWENYYHVINALFGGIAFDASIYDDSTQNSVAPWEVRLFEKAYGLREGVRLLICGEAQDFLSG